MILTSWLKQLRTFNGTPKLRGKIRRRNGRGAAKPAQAESLESRTLLTNLSVFTGGGDFSQANAVGFSNPDGSGNDDITVDVNVNSFGTQSGGFETQGEVTINAGDNIIFNAGKEIRGTFLVELNVDEVGFGGTADVGVGGVLNLTQGSVRSGVIEINGNDDNDTFNIADSAIDTNANSKTIDGQGGTDTANINLSGSTGKAGAANATLTESVTGGFAGGPQSFLEYTGPGGFARNLTIKNVENINITGLAVDIIDQVDPTWTTSPITVQGNTATGADNLNSALLTALQAQASDNTTSSANLTFSFTGGDIPFGTSSVEFTATDEAGNSANATIEVTVNQAPFVISEDFVRSEDISFSRDDTAGLTDNIVLSDGFRAQSTAGDSGGTVEFNAGDDLLLDFNSTVQAAAGITLNVDFYGTLGSSPVPVDPDPDVGGIATLNGQLLGTSVTVNGLTDDDTFNLNAASFLDTPMTVNGGGGSDTVLVDLATVTNPRLVRRGSASAVITSDSHEDITLNSVETINTAFGSFVTTSIAPMGGTYSIKSDGSGNLIFEDADGSFVIQALSSLSTVVIDAGVGDDVLTVDHSAGFFAADVIFNGGAGGNDKLSVIGNGTSNAVYTPSATTTGNGHVNVVDDGESSLITFTGLEPVDISGMDQATLSLTGGVGDSLTVTTGNDFATDSQPALRVAGTVMGTPVVPIETAAFFGNATVTIAADAVTVTSADNAHGNARVNIGGGTVSLAGNVAATTVVLIEPTTATVLTDDVTLSAAELITVNSTVDGPHNLVLNSAGEAGLNGAVGGTTALASLTTDAGGFSFFADVTTTGDQTFNDSVGVNTDADSTATLTAANVQFFGDVDAFGNENVAIVGNMVLGNSVDDNVGEFGTTATEVPGTFSVSGSTTIATATSSGKTTVLTTGNQTFTGPFTIAATANPILDSTGGAVTFGGSIIVESGGELTVGDVSDGSLATGGLDVQAGSTLNVDIAGIATAGTDFDQVVVTGAVALGGTLNITDTSAATAAVNDEIVLIDNDLTDAVSGTFTAMPNGTNVTINGEIWQLRYDGGDGNDVTLKFGAPLPSVNLSVSSNAGNEAEGTVITVTATASSAVDGEQTVDVAVDQGGSSGVLTATDYTLSSGTITIADGATEGSVTFTVLNDTEPEVPETGTLTISNPSAGLTLGTTLSQDIVITSDEVAGFTVTPDPVIVADNGTADVSIVLRAQPTADVSVSMFVFGSEVTVPSDPVVFTTANWDTPQQVTVTGVNNTTESGDQTDQLELFSTSDDASFSSLFEFVDVIVADTDTTLKVNSTSLTPAGFVFEFSEPVDGSRINVAAGASGQLSDVTIVGAATGPVRGSLLFSADSRRATFVRTQGLLEPDDYTITLRSDATGWTSLSGKTLDGDGDDANGVDYTTTVTVGTPPAGTIIASLPEFTRGAGQDVVLTGSAGIPLTLSHAQNVSRLDVTVNYDPTLLTITDFVSEVTGVTRTIDVTTPGVAILSLTSATQFSTTLDQVVAGHFVATVPTNAPYPGKHILDLTGLSIVDNQGTPAAINAIDDDGIHVTAFFGDLSGDAAYNVPDVILLQRIVAQLSEGVPAFQGADPSVVGDITGDGNLQVNDAISLQRVIAQLAVPNVPALPAGVTAPAPTGPDPRIFIPQDLTGSIGDTVTVPVRLEVTEAAGTDLGGSQVTISYDPAVFSVGNPQVAGLQTGFQFTPNLNTPGQIILVASSSSGSGLQTLGVTGALFTVDFTVLQGAATGNTAINLLANINSTATSAFDTNTLANLVLTPVPTNSPSDAVDGIFNVTANTAPSVVVTPNTGTTSDNPILFTFTFDEAVTGFDATDVTLTNGTAGTFTAVSTTVYTLGVVPTADGTVTAAVAADAAVNAGSVGNTAGSGSVTFSTTNVAPSVVVTPNTGMTSDNPILFTFTFSEAVTGFDATDVTLTNGTAGTFTAVSTTVYTLGVVPTADGTVTAAVAANAAIDSGALGNTAGSGSVTFNTAPSLVVTPNTGTTSDSPVLFTFTFSEAVTGFDATDVTLTNGTAGTFTAVSTTVYTLGIVPTADGTVTAAVAADAAVDAGTAGNTAGSGSVTFNAAPSLVVTPNSGTTPDSPILFTFTFNEAVTGFDATDVTLTNGTAGTFTAVSTTVYTLGVVPTADGVVTAAVAANAAVDEGAVGNTAGSGSVTSDAIVNIAPSVVVTPNTGTTSDNPILFTFTFSEAVTGFDATDVTLTNGTAGTFTPVSTTVYTLGVVPTADGTVTAAVAANAAVDSRALGNTAGAGSVTFATNVAPSVVVTPNTGTTSDNPILFTFTFDEAVTGFDATDVTLTNGTAGTFTAVSTTVYTLGVVPTADGTVTAAVAANAAIDSGALGNTAGSGSVTFVANVAPVLTITPNTGTTGDNPIIFFLNFNEDVTGFAQSDIVITNGVSRTFTAVDARSYTLSVVPAGAGAVTASVAANSVLDTGTPAMGNAATSATVNSTLAASLPAPALTVAPKISASARPSLSWAAAAGAASYEVWFASITPLQSRLFTASSSVTVTNWTPPADLEPAFYRYWVRSVNAAGSAGPWSSPQQFEVQPTLLGPLTPTFETRPTFRWSPIPNATGYQIFVRTRHSTVGDNGDIVVSNIPATETSWVPPQNLPEGPIRWWIRAVDSAGNRGWSDVGLTEIRARTTVETATATQIAWAAFPTTTRYILHVQDNADDSVVIREDNLTGTSFTTSPTLGSGTYRAWVKAIDASGNGLWSRPLEFTVASNSISSEDEGTPSLLETEMVVATVVSEFDTPTVAAGTVSTSSQEALAKRALALPVPMTRADSGSQVAERANAVEAELKILDVVMGQSMDFGDLMNDV